MTKKSVAILKSSTSSVIKTNGANQITGAKDQAIRFDDYDSFLNKVDGGLVIDVECGYSVPVTPVNDYAFATKKYVDDNSGGTGNFKADGSVPMTGNFYGGGYDLREIDFLSDGSGINSLGVTNRIGTDYLGNQVFRYYDVLEGFQVTTGAFFAGLKTTALTANRTFELPNVSGTVALTSDIPTVAGVYAPIAGGFSFTGNVNGVTPTELTYVSGLTSAAQTQLNSKEPTITASTTNKYWRGDKTFQILDTSVVPENGSLYYTAARLRAETLAGLSITGVSISAGSSVLAAFGALQNQINGLLGGAIYQGIWNASTNSPSLASGVGTKGYYYVVSVAGSTSIDGINDWAVGDWIIFNGTVWNKVDNTDAVSSVNGSIGAVSLTGTTNRITVTGSVWDISSSYVGQSSITTLGTIGTGVWQGTAIADGYISSAAVWNAKQAALSGTGFVKSTAGTISYDNSTYLTANQTITLSGDVTGSGTTSITTAISNATVIGKSLTVVPDFTLLSGSNTIQKTFDKSFGAHALSQKEVGTVILNTFTSAGDLSSFTNTGSASFTFNTPGLLISGGASNYSNYFTNSYVTILNRYEYSIEFTSTVNGTGIAIGFPSSLGVRIDTSAGANRGKLYIENFTAGVGSTIVTSATALTYTNTTDVIRLSYQRIRNTIYAKLENVTTPSNLPIYLTYQQNMLAGAALQGVGNPTIYAYGGTQIVTKYTYSNKEIQKSKLLILGDSNAEGWGQGATTWAGVLSSNFKSHIALQTRAGATTTTISGAIAETLLLSPNFALVNIGTNDAVASKSLGTFQTDFALVIKQLTDNGITPIICTIIPHYTSATNTLIDSYNSWITSTYGSLYTVIDTFTAQALAGLYNPLYNSGVHMTALGGLNFANTVIPALNALTLPTSDIWSNTVTHGVTKLRNSTGGIAIEFSGITTQSNIDFYCTNVINGKVLNLNFAASAVNYFSMLARATGSSPQFQAIGADTNIGFDFLPKGLGAYYWRSNVVNGSGTNHHIFASQNSTVGEAVFASYLNGATGSLSNKSTLLFSALNSGGSATLKTWIGFKAENITAASERTSFFIDNLVANVRTNALNIDGIDAVFKGSFSVAGLAGAGTEMVVVNASGLMSRQAIPLGTVTSVTGTANQIGSTGGATPVISIASNPIIPGIQGMVLPSGSTAGRNGTPTNGTIRYSTTLTALEAFYGGAWNTLGAGGGSGITRSVNVVSTSGTLGSTALTDYIYKVTATSTQTLPTAVGNTNRYTIKATGGTVTVDTTSSQTIDGSATAVLNGSVNSSIDLISDGTNWILV